MIPIKIFFKLNLNIKIHKQKGSTVKIKFNLITSENPNISEKTKNVNIFMLRSLFLTLVYKKQNANIKTVIPRFSEEVLLCKNG